ncbi:MAG: cytochrome c [Gammaproteobacteria bacterium]|nr:cytochrome c [Gammaproteobacteria bacterium]
MKKIWTNFVMCTGIGVFTLLAFVSLNTVIAQSQTPPPVDRWDPWWTERDMWSPGMMEPGQQQRMARHWTFMHSGTPLEYRGQWNPLALTPDVVRAGGLLYQEQCAVCHGAQGMGDGEAAKALNPSPALLAYMIQMPMSVDEYLMWSIAEGGKQFGTDMPAFKRTLSPEDIWKIVAYMRGGFPTVATEQ